MRAIVRWPYDTVSGAQRSERGSEAYLSRSLPPMLMVAVAVQCPPRACELVGCEAAIVDAPVLLFCNVRCTRPATLRDEEMRSSGVAGGGMAEEESSDSRTPLLEAR
jgi:hypothetical protein